MNRAEDILCFQTENSRRAAGIGILMMENDERAKETDMFKMELWAIWRDVDIFRWNYIVSCARRYISKRNK